MAAFEHMANVIDVKDPKNFFLCIGDGSLCLTGALFAFLTKGIVESIDPKINHEKVYSWIQQENVRHLGVFGTTYQEYGYMNVSCDLILVHAHVTLVDLVKYFPAWRYIYTCPCCDPVHQTFSKEYQKEHNISTILAEKDPNIDSPKNEVFIYRNNNNKVFANTL
jgi:hypothetical protein